MSLVFFSCQDIESDTQPTVGNHGGSGGAGISSGYSYDPDPLTGMDVNYSNSGIYDWRTQVRGSAATLPHDPDAPVGDPEDLKEALEDNLADDPEGTEYDYGLEEGWDY